ncbi:MAG: ABC transporter ATP-binding protein [Bacteroidetes bacterium]|nr:ABC transporter ATP-binding protein [Bacteroidota bacterium]
MIRIENLSKRFGKLQVLKQIHFTCNQGECIALIGPNGCGKTTLIKSILGLVVPDTGEMYFNNNKMNAQWSYRSKIGYMPQIGRYPDNMSIGQLFTMMKDLRKHEQHILDESLIKTFGIDNMLNKRMNTLSGGTRQKVSAALAFLFNADVLILDEPTAGLDPLSSEQLKEKIIEEKAKGKLILITSHILSELDEVVSHIMYMQEGELIFYKDIGTLQNETAETKLSKMIAKKMIENKQYA